MRLYEFLWAFFNAVYCCYKLVLDACCCIWELQTCSIKTNYLQIGTTRCIYPCKTHESLTHVLYSTMILRCFGLLPIWIIPNCGYQVRTKNSYHLLGSKIFSACKNWCCQPRKAQTPWTSCGPAQFLAALFLISFVMCRCNVGCGNNFDYYSALNYHIFWTTRDLWYIWTLFCLWFNKWKRRPILSMFWNNILTTEICII